MLVWLFYALGHAIGALNVGSFVVFQSFSWHCHDGFGGFFESLLLFSFVCSSLDVVCSGCLIFYSWLGAYFFAILKQLSVSLNLATIVVVRPLLAMAVFVECYNICSVPLHKNLLPLLFAEI